jgi:acetyltransferase-like isoleucine patch superfamily enzyme
LTPGAFLHPTAEVSPKAQIGDGTKVWHQAQIREGAVIGKECIIGKGVYIDFDVHIGDRCKLQNGVCVYHGVSLGKGVFLGPGVLCLNDKYPRAINANMTLKSDEDWIVSTSYINDGASVGGGAILLPGVRIGKWALVGSGSVIVKDIPDHGLVYGNPARLYGFVCKCGQRLEDIPHHDEAQSVTCKHCGEENIILPVSSDLSNH